MIGFRRGVTENRAHGVVIGVERGTREIKAIVEGEAGVQRGVICVGIERDGGVGGGAGAGVRRRGGNGGGAKTREEEGGEKMLRRRRLITRG